MLSYGEKFKWGLCAKLGGGVRNPDNQVCAATYAELYLNSAVKNSTWVRAAIAELDAEIQDHASVRNWNWVDALFMAMSVYSRIGAITGQQAYFDKMYDNFIYSALGGSRGVYNFWSDTDWLFYRDPPNGKPNGVFWSRGNGWAAAALVQAIKHSPQSDPHVQTYQNFLKLQMAALVPLQGLEGCWRSSLKDPGEGSKT